MTTLLYLYLTGWLITGSYHAGKCEVEPGHSMTKTECKVFMGAASAGWPYYLVVGE